MAEASLRIAPAAAAPAEHARHHVALRLLPFLFILYIANYLDRTSVAYAALGMARDLGFDDRVFGPRHRHFLPQLRGLADSSRLTSATLVNS